MARAETITKLPLDRWAEIIGFHPLHFNQLSSSTYLTSNTCGLSWFQHAWQFSDRLSREDIAFAIRQAEGNIETEIGYNLLPAWTVQERLEFDRPAFPELLAGYGTNVRGLMRSLSLKKGHVISGGVRVKDGIETATVVRSDADGDGYDELVTVIVGTSVTDPDELKVYYPGEDGADKWEIRPINVSIDTDAAQATITFKSWQIVDPDKQSALNAESIDAETDTNYLTTVDVYRVYNDPQTQVQFLWERDSNFTCECAGLTCITCQLSTQTGCFHNRNARLGIIVPSPGTWSAANQQFSGANWAVCRAPDQARVSYYSGNRDLSLDRPESVMEDYWATAVAYYAASLLDKDGCGCSNASEFLWQWRTDVSQSQEGRGSFSATPAQISNRLGSTKGAIYAWNKIQQNGRRLGR